MPHSAQRRAQPPVVRPPDAAGNARRWYALGLLCLAFFLIVQGATSVFAAAPSIVRDLRFPAGGAQLVFTAYALAFGGLLLLGGRAADLFGRRRAFMTGVGLFVLSSMLCGLAWSEPVLIGARVIQGASGAIISPAALSLLTSTFEDGAQRNRALGAWSAIGGFGATAGLLAGGLITASLGWQWVYFINVPFGAAVLALSPVLLPADRDHDTGRTLDLAGGITITVALALLVYAITSAPSSGWDSARTIGMLCAGAALIAVFTGIEARSPAPLLPLRLLLSRTRAGGNLVVITAGMSVDGLLFILALYTQQVLGYSAVRFGLTLAAMTIASVAGSYAAQRAVTRYGPRAVAISGLALIAASCLLLTRIPVHGGFPGSMLVSLVIFGLGMGGAFVPGSVASLAGFAEQDSGVAAGVQSTSFAVGTALGVAILSTVAAARTARLRAGGHGLPRAVALTDGYRSAFAAAVVIAALGILAAATMLGRRPD